MKDPNQKFDGNLREEDFRAIIEGRRDFHELISPTSYFAGGGSLAHFNQRKCILPGSFNPLHDGHLKIASLAQDWLSLPCWFELSLVNADKPQTDYEVTINRVSQDFGEIGLLVSSLPTFVQKAKSFPNSVFLVGADTIERIDDTRYYGGDSANRDKAINQIRDYDCSFMVFSRKIDDEVHSESNICLSSTTRSLCEFVSEVKFLMDLSSTELRNRNKSSESH